MTATIGSPKSHTSRDMRSTMGRMAAMSSCSRARIGTTNGCTALLKIVRGKAASVIAMVYRPRSSTVTVLPRTKVSACIMRNVSSDRPGHTASEAEQCPPGLGLPPQRRPEGGDHEGQHEADEGLEDGAPQQRPHAVQPESQADGREGPDQPCPLDADQRRAEAEVTLQCVDPGAGEAR